MEVSRGMTVCGVTLDNTAAQVSSRLEKSSGPALVE